MQRLSSQLSLVTKYLTPLVLMVVAVTLLFGNWHEPHPGLWPAGLFSIVGLVAWWWTWPIRTVHLGHGKFILGDLHRTCEVPTAHLAAIRKNR